MCHLDDFFARDASEVVIQLRFNPVDEVCVGVTCFEGAVDSVTENVDSFTFSTWDNEFVHPKRPFGVVSTHCRIYVPVASFWKILLDKDRNLYS